MQQPFHCQINLLGFFPRFKHLFSNAHRLFSCHSIKTNQQEMATHFALHELTVPFSLITRYPFSYLLLSTPVFCIDIKTNLAKGVPRCSIEAFSNELK